MLATTSDYFCCCSRAYTGDSPQLSTLRMNIKLHKITNQCHKWLPCGTGFTMTLGGVTPLV